MTPEEFMRNLQEIRRSIPASQPIHDFVRRRNDAILALVHRLSDAEITAVTLTRPGSEIPGSMLRAVGTCLYRELEGRSQGAISPPEPGPAPGSDPLTAWERLGADWMGS